MRKEVIGTCPVCSNKLLATRLTCQVCHTEITGEFELSRFSNLSKDEIDFVETFVSVYGSIKEMEKKLGISYPTVKKTLDHIIGKMGYSQQSVIDDNQTESVLNQLENKELSVEQALKMLQK